MSVSRRCFLKFFGGATAGIVVSPLPWKLLDDVSIWTQNGSWVAETARGPVSHMFTTCTLCPAGCGLNLRRIGDHTVSAWGVGGHPRSGGRICPAGLGFAQIAYHPARIRGTAGRGASSTDPWRLLETKPATEQVGRTLARLRAENATDRFAILDLRPGRSLSVLYDDFLTDVGGGHYLTMPGGREQAATAWNDLMDTPGTEPGFDLDRAGAIISFGAPISDGWLGGQPDRAPFVIQIQTNGSVNTDQADVWLPITPGTEAALALGLAHIFRVEMSELLPGVPAQLESGFEAAFGELVKRHSPEYVARITGIDPHVLRCTAWELSRKNPVVAVGGGDPGGGPLGRPEELALLVLNLTLGCLNQAGGMILRQDLPGILRESPRFPAESLLEIPDGSLDLLLVDGSFPGTMIPPGLLRRKMRSPQSLIVGMSPYVAGPTAEADIVIPTAAPGEWVDDSPSQALAPCSAYALSAATEEGPSWALHPADLLGLLAEATSLGSRRPFNKSRHEEIIDRRIAAIHGQGRGLLFDPVGGKTASVAERVSPADLKKVLSRGGCWTDQPAEPGQASISFRTDHLESLKEEVEGIVPGRLQAQHDSPKAFPLVLMLEGPPVTSNGGILPTVVNKLYRESNLLPSPGTARINPATARDLGLGKGTEAHLKTSRGKMEVTVALDEKVRPGVVLMSPGPNPENLGDPASGRGDILQLCGAATNPVRRVERAALQVV